MSEKVSKVLVAWECPACGHKHVWVWDRLDASNQRITMECDRCESTMNSNMFRIGKRVWSVHYPGR
jgi:transcription elongation factor Elf1